MQPGKSTPAVVQTFKVKIVIAQFKQPSMKVRADSDEGASHDFRKVGRAAAWSAQTKDTNAIVGSFTKAQKTRPANEIDPHTMSKVPIFHTACELRNDAPPRQRERDRASASSTKRDPRVVGLPLRRRARPRDPRATTSLDSARSLRATCRGCKSDPPSPDSAMARYTKRGSITPQVCPFSSPAKIRESGEVR